MSSRLAVVFALLLIVGGVVWRLATPSMEAYETPLEARRAALRLLGEEIRHTASPTHALIFANPFTQEPGRSAEIYAFEEAGINGIQEGLGSEVEVEVVFPKIQARFESDPASANAPPDSTTPLSYIMDPHSWEELLAQHPDCDVAFSLIGLPVGIQDTTFWNQNDPVGFALLKPDLSVLGAKESALAAFQAEKIIAAVVEDGSIRKPLLVTRSNVVELLDTRAALFGFGPRY
jgi:hypothetical protein